MASDLLEQITNAPRHGEGRTPMADVCRHLGVDEANLCLWKEQYGKLGPAERQLRDENARLKRLVGELTLNKNILGDVVQNRL